MNELLAPVLDVICHRSGEYSDTLPLCLRCSSVYAGALLGSVFEIVVQAEWKGRQGYTGFVISSLGLILMAVIGFSGIYGWFSCPTTLKVFTALYFGWAVSFFSLSAVAAELRVNNQNMPSMPARSVALRLGFLGLIALYTAFVAAENIVALRILGYIAPFGVIVVFIEVNFAVVFALLRRVNSVKRRILCSIIGAFGLILAEFASFALWRAGL